MPGPLIIGIGAGIAALIGAGAMADASDRKEKAKERYDDRLKKFRATERHYESWQKKSDSKFKTLGQCRLEALKTLGKAVEFLKKARIRDRDLEQEFNITPQQLKAWEGASINAAEVLSGMAGSVGAGAATAAGVYGAVSLLGTASTGTAIATLSGAAAKSATLAWLGGGAIAAGGGGMALGTMVLGGVVAGPALLVAGLFAHSKAEKVETEVAEKIAEMDEAEVQIDQKIAVVKVALRRVDELFKSTTQIEKTLKQLLDRGTPTNLEYVHKVAYTARSLGDLLDVAITDTEGNLIIT